MSEQFKSILEMRDTIIAQLAETVNQQKVEIQRLRVNQERIEALASEACSLCDEHVDDDGDYRHVETDDDCVAIDCIWSRMWDILLKKEAGQQ